MKLTEREEQPKYELLVLDMDGTLLNPNKQITPAVHEALEIWKSQGGRVTIASGRFPASVWLHAQAAGMNFPLVALNGAVIADVATGRLLSGLPLQTEHAEPLIKLVADYGAYVHLYGYNVLYVQELNPMNTGWPLANVVVSPDKPLTADNYREQIGFIQVEPVGDLRKFLSVRKEPIYKATIICDDPILLHRLINEIQMWNVFTITSTGKRRFDVNAYGVSKQSALAHLCREQKIPSLKVAAMGDYDNDIEMLKWAGLGIAMGNAEEYVKEIATVVTSSNQEDGVAQAVLKYLIQSN